MANRPAAIRKADIQRKVKSVMEAGLSITMIEFEGPKLVIHTGDGSNPQDSALEKWRSKHG